MVLLPPVWFSYQRYLPTYAEGWQKPTRGITHLALSDIAKEGGPRLRIDIARYATSTSATSTRATSTSATSTSPGTSVCALALGRMPRFPHKTGRSNKSVQLGT